MARQSRVDARSGERKLGARLGMTIRQKRKQLGMTLEELSRKTGLSLGFISRVERNLVTPSLGSMVELAHGLDCTLDHFIAAPSGSKNISRQAERTVFSIGPSGVQYARVSGEFPGQDITAFIMKIPPGFTSEVSSHEGEELLCVLSGELFHTLDGRTYKLTAGDILHFPSHSTHSFGNHSTAELVVLWAGTTPIFDKKVDFP